MILNDEIAAHEEALRKAVQADREALTSWQLEDAKRPRPEPTAPALEREIEEKKADRGAANAAVERVYEEKARFVEKHRRRLIGQADKATREARERYAGAIEEAEQARAELIDSRAAALGRGSTRASWRARHRVTRPRSRSTSADRSRRRSR